MSWTLDRDRATLNSDFLRLALDVNRPRHGLQEIVVAGDRLDGLRSLQMTADPPVLQETIIESYVRGTDLVATYAQLPERTVRPQIYYRHLDHATCGSDQASGVELVIGVETSLLNSNPAFSSLTEAQAEEVFWLASAGPTWSRFEQQGTVDLAKSDGTGAFLFRLTGPDVSYAELILPADFQGARLSRDRNGVRLSYQLFPEFLEKGVLRKARVWAIFLDRSDDLDRAADCYQRMLASPPPLTV